MKKNQFVAVAVIIVFSACKSLTERQKAELEKLRKEQSELQVKIDTLVAAIAKSDTSKKEEKMTHVEVTSLNQDVFCSYIEVQGKVDADENVTISAESGGIVNTINVKAGDEVTKGQVLAELDAKVVQQSIVELQGSLDLATTLYAKQKSLWDQKIGSEVQYITAKNQKESLEKKMSTMQQQLEMSRIKSPINGTVDESFLKLGQMAAPGFPAFRVVNFAHLKVKAEVPENYASIVKRGNAAIVVFPDTRDTVIAQITFSAKVINPANRTFNVEMALENNKDYHPNMIAILKIADYTNNKAISIPVGTIQHAEEGDFVFLNKDGKAKKTRVKVGKIYNSRAEIKEGLNQGDQLITNGFQELNEGERIATNKQ